LALEFDIKAIQMLNKAQAAEYHERSYNAINYIPVRLLHAVQYYIKNDKLIKNCFMYYGARFHSFGLDLPARLDKSLESRYRHALLR